MQDELAENITLEQGKTFADAKGDVFRGLGRPLILAGATCFGRTLMQQLLHVLWSRVQPVQQLTATSCSGPCLAALHAWFWLSWCGYKQQPVGHRFWEMLDISSTVCSKGPPGKGSKCLSGDGP